MLLRLLPAPTPSQPAPPTILFTLPLPTHPYTSRGLPLPSNLLAHHQVCDQEGIQCANVLLGDKSCWMNGIVQDVTFSLATSETTIQLSDASTITFTFSPPCAETLERVVNQVNLSFQAPPTPIRPLAAPASRVEPRRSTSSLLLTLLSPLLASPHTQQAVTPPTAASVAPPAAPLIHTARTHRRQARSLLVDAYRQHVLPALRHHLPAAYLPWSIQGEIAQKTEDFHAVKRDIDALLATAGVELFTHCALRERSISTSTASSCCSSSCDSEDGPVTPATSRFTSPLVSVTSLKETSAQPSRAISPAAYLLSLPAHGTLPVALQARYTTLLTRLGKLASRMASIKKLSGRYEREEAKRRWLEAVDATRLVESATRRAAANGNVRARGNLRDGCKPTKRSSLWRSYTPDNASDDDDEQSLGEELESDCEHIETPRRPSLRTMAVGTYPTPAPALISSDSDAELLWDDEELKTPASPTCESIATFATSPKPVMITWDNYSMTEADEHVDAQGYRP